MPQPSVRDNGDTPFPPASHAALLERPCPASELHRPLGVREDKCSESILRLEICRRCREMTPVLCRSGGGVRQRNRFRMCTHLSAARVKGIVRGHWRHRSKCDWDLGRFAWDHSDPESAHCITSSMSSAALQPCRRGGYRSLHGGKLSCQECPPKLKALSIFPASRLGWSHHRHLSGTCLWTAKGSFNSLQYREMQRIYIDVIESSEIIIDLTIDRDQNCKGQIATPPSITVVNGIANAQKR